MRLYDSAAEERASTGTSVLTGVVVNNCDLIRQGKVAVRLPALGQEVWARLSGVGGGGGAGLFFNPAIGDEVLVAVENGDPGTAYLLGGLWSAKKAPPIGTAAVAVTTRRLSTGPAGHEITLDDATQTISIVTSTRQRVVLSPESVEISDPTGAVSVVLDTASGAITLRGTDIRLQGSHSISLEAPSVTVHGATDAALTSTGTTTVSGTTAVRIN